MSLGDHLRELRTRLMIMVGTLVVFTCGAYFIYDQVFRFMTAPYCRAIEDTGKPCTFYLTDILGGFLLHVKVAGWTGFMCALPVILWQLWRFVMPGLYKNERRYTIAFVVSSIFLFLWGAILAYYTLPPMLSWLMDSAGPDKLIQQIPSPDRYFWLSALLMLAFGIGFEFPLVLIGLQMVGVLKTSLLSKSRRFAAVLILVVVAVITPGGDPISLIVLSAPMYVFYEMSIVVGHLLDRRRRKADQLKQAAAAESRSATTAVSTSVALPVPGPTPPPLPGTVSTSATTNETAPALTPPPLP
jgi:sec-independent protein translocase protein TatC